MQPSDLRAFSTRIAEHFNAGRIRAPVHLDDGNEEPLIRYFQGVNPEDWVLCSWRAHYKALLKGVPAEDLERQILHGRSISLCFPQHRILSSAMVAGNLPIALGIAMAIKRQGKHKDEHVHAFLGDMTATTGQFHECLAYAQNFDLPITFIVENNKKSVCTDTYATWNIKNEDEIFVPKQSKIYRFEYESQYPHAGAGQRVNF